MSEAADQEVIEVAPVEEDTSGIVFSEESPAEEIVDPTEKAEVKEPVRFSEDQQKVFDEAINKKTAKTREAERLAQKLQEDLEQLRKQVPQETRPDIPASISSKTRTQVSAPAASAFLSASIMREISPPEATL